MSIYQARPDRPPDSDFEPGELHHLVAGNRGRLLDARRTGVSIVGVRPVVGCFDLRIEDFEDAGATWTIPFEKIHHYQFERGAARAETSEVAGFREAVRRFDRRQTIPLDPGRTRETAQRLDDTRGDASAWLERESRFFRERGRLPAPDRRLGDERLYADLRGYLDARGVGDLEESFARQYVSNPDSGELVKGHRIVIAELGIVPYEGDVVRDPALFDGAGTRARRAEHVIARLAFVRAVFDRLDRRRVVLYRGLSTERPLTEPGNRTFVSATFDEAVARSHYESGSGHATRLLMRQAVPVERLFMTYLETPQMNEHFREAEAVLLYDPDARPF